jgi:hypothetical protein
MPRTAECIDTFQSLFGKMQVHYAKETVETSAGPEQREAGRPLIVEGRVDLRRIRGAKTDPINGIPAAGVAIVPVIIETKGGKKQWQPKAMPTKFK